MSTAKLSERMSRFSGSPTSALGVRITELRRLGKDIISLNVGEPDFGSPDYVKVAGIEAIINNFTKYTPTNGIYDLREAIVKKFKEDNNIEYSTDEVTVCVGAKHAVYNSLMVLCGEGDEVLIPIPCWVSYTEMTKLAGATPVMVPCKEDYTLDLDAIEKAITPNTKAIVICTPNNPTGIVYSEESLRALASLAIEHDFFIIIDEIYEKIIYNGHKHFSVASISKDVRDHTVTINGFSKAYAMTGWRLGYVGARKDIIKAIMSFQSQVTSSCCAISQKAGVAALSGPQADTENMVEEFRKRKDYIYTRINEIEGLACPDPQGAFYVLVDVSYYIGKKYDQYIISDSGVLCEYLLEKASVSVVPGEAYNIAGKIRISYANSMENIQKALDQIQAALALLE